MRISDDKSRLGIEKAGWEEGAHPRGFHGRWIQGALDAIQGARSSASIDTLHHLGNASKALQAGDISAARKHLGYARVTQISSGMSHMNLDRALHTVDRNIGEAKAALAAGDPTGAAHDRTDAARHARDGVISLREGMVAATVLNNGMGIAMKAEDQPEELDIAVTKANDESRYTFGPLYAPGMVDAHGEFVTAPALQHAVWNFARSGARTIHKQHNTDTDIGEIVEQVAWPYPQDVELSIPGQGVRKATLPAGTVYVGVIWSEDAWPLVKSGAITGYSLGGRALRVHGASLPLDTTE